MIKNILQEGFDNKIKTIQPVSGGDINEAFLVSLEGEQDFFVKYNAQPHAQDIFIKEKKGLNTLGKHLSSFVPTVHFVKDLSTGAILVMDYHVTVGWEMVSYASLGRKLAQIHQSTKDKYGLDHDNYLGHLPQKNRPYQNFFDFFYEDRILPLINKAVDLGYLSHNYLDWREYSENILRDIVPIEHPTLIHGDLWSGNIINTAQGPMIIDPAIAYSHREFDLAMSKLFGGFGTTFYDAYQEIYPLAEGWKNRIDLFQLYPLLAHLVMFGRGYYQSCVRILDKYAR